MKPYDFGNMDSVLWLDPRTKAFRSPLTIEIEYFSKNGYRDGVNMWGAAYDWRFAGDRQGAQDNLYPNLAKLIEDAYNMTGGKKVALIGNSLGTLVGHGFLVQQPIEWREKYIAM